MSVDVVSQTAYPRTVLIFIFEVLVLVDSEILLTCETLTFWHFRAFIGICQFGGLGAFWSSCTPSPAWYNTMMYDSLVN